MLHPMRIQIIGTHLWRSERLLVPIFLRLRERGGGKDNAKLVAAQARDERRPEFGGDIA